MIIQGSSSAKRVWSKIPLFILVSASVAFFCAGCGSKEESSVADPTIQVAMLPTVNATIQIPAVSFRDITARAGIDFEHTNGAFGEKLLPETMGGGVAIIDYDKDGLPDILFVNSCFWPGHEKGRQPTLKLYRNLGNATFKDVTTEAGLAVTMYGMGVTVGDYDNDGWPDIFISGVGGNRLFRNVSDGKGGRRFEDVTAAAGVGGSDRMPALGGADFLKVEKPISFPSSCAFLDYDGDGKLDLFVCHYVTWSPTLDTSLGSMLVGVGRAYGPPTGFKGAHCVLYRNLGNGRFEDVSKKAGIQVFEEQGAMGPQPAGKSLGVYICDVDDDGFPDIFVANDMTRNFFFHNRGDGTFEEIGKLAGVAWAEGKARGAMGIDGGECRCDLVLQPGLRRFGIALANFSDESITLLRLDDPKQLLFTEVAMAEGIGGPSRVPLKFGMFYFDYDLDGRQDLLTCNGHLEPDINKVQASQTYVQPALLFWNTGSKPTFVRVTEKEAGPDLFKPMVGRGCAFADIDGDGYLDVVLVANGGKARLLRNNGGTGNNWIRLDLEGDGERSNRSAIGARLTVEAGGMIQRQQVQSARGYLSQSELTLTFGLGKTTQVDRVVVEWPGKRGFKQEFSKLAVNKVHHLKQGEQELVQK